MIDNVIRTLIENNGTCWKKEMIADLIGHCGKPTDTDLDLLDKTLDMLRAKGIIDIKVGVRGSCLTQGTYTDQHIRLLDLEAAHKAYPVLRDIEQLFKR